MMDAAKKIGFGLWERSQTISQKKPRDGGYGSDKVVMEFENILGALPGI
jgi:hypothetical protein